MTTRLIIEMYVLAVAAQLTADALSRVGLVMGRRLLNHCVDLGRRREQDGAGPPDESDC